MLLAQQAEPFNDPNWVYEIKHAAFAWPSSSMGLSVLLSNMARRLVWNNLKQLHVLGSFVFPPVWHARWDCNCITSPKHLRAVH